MWLGVVTQDASYLERRAPESPGRLKGHGVYHKRYYKGGTCCCGGMLQVC